MQPRKRSADRAVRATPLRIPVCAHITSRVLPRGCPCFNGTSIAKDRARAALPLPGLGLIREDAPADVVVFAEDPTRDLAALSSIRLVVADGRPYPKQVLDDAVNRYHSFYGGWLCDRFTILMFHLFGGLANSGSHSH